MKLISCYIEGYGKIKEREFSFEEGLTPFLWENGEGKSTLASFLKAMLYGLKGYRKGSLEFCDREHFYPFDGGRFGGNLRLEAGGKEYKIERFFADKSETGDTLTVYENGTMLLNPPVDFGRVLLGVDKESFERTLFLRHDDLEISSTSGIHARLNQFLEGGDEEGGLDEALDRLEKAAKVYKRSKSGNDKVSIETTRIARLSVEIENAAAIKAHLEEKYARADELRGRMRELQKGITLAQKQRERASQMEHYDSILREVSTAERALTDLSEKYPFGVPTLEDTKAFNAYVVASNELQMKIDGGALADEEKGALATLSTRFQGGVPSEAALLSAEKSIDRAKGLGLALSQKRAPSLRERKLEESFSRQTPTPSALQTAEENLAAYKEKKKALESAVYPQPTARKVSARGYAFAAIFAALLAVAGVVALALGKLLVGGALAAGGLVGDLAVGFLYLNRKSSASVAVENTRAKELERELFALERALQAFLFPYGYGVEEGVEIAFATFKRDFSEYEDGRVAQAEELDRLAQLRGEKEELEQELSAFFARYGLIEGEFFERLSALKTLLARLQALAARRAESEKICAAALAQKGVLEEKMAAYRAKYRLYSVDVEELLEDARKRERLLLAVKEGREKAVAFKREKGLEDGEAVFVDLDGLQESYAKLQGELASLEREIGEDERSAELLEGYENDKRAAEENLKEYKRKYRLLSATATRLNDAAGRLRDRYVKPIKDEFLRYAEIIERALGEKVVITKDFELRFERGGVERSEKHLSSGQRSVCALCFRLALVKNMYRGQLPFLVLDDPFLTLDEEHIARVREVLKALSEDMQMVYLTCHPSRKI